MTGETPERGQGQVGDGPGPFPIPDESAERQAEDMTDTMTSTSYKKLQRTRDGRLIAGVGSGIARYLGVDPVLVRLAFVVLTAFGAAGILLYAACWILMPEDEPAPAAPTPSIYDDPRSPTA
jgi:phage shock protein C